MTRALMPSLTPTGLGSAIAAIYAAVVMIANAVSHHGVINPQVIVAAVAAVAFLFARSKVTPVADPRDGNGQPLTAIAPVVPVETVHLPPLPEIAPETAPDLPPAPPA